MSFFEIARTWQGRSHSQNVVLLALLVVSIASSCSDGGRSGAHVTSSPSVSQRPDPKDVYCPALRTFAGLSDDMIAGTETPTELTERLDAIQTEFEESADIYRKTGYPTTATQVGELADSVGRIKVAIDAAGSQYNLSSAFVTAIQEATAALEAIPTTCAT